MSFKSLFKCLGLLYYTLLPGEGFGKDVWRCVGL